MKTSAQRTHQPQEAASSSMARSQIETPGSDRRERPFLDWHSAFGLRGAPSTRRGEAEEPRATITAAVLSRFRHDFSRIPTHSSSPRQLQAKLAINRPVDEFEQEADRVAETAVSMPAPRLQRKCACGGTPAPTGECEACRQKRLSLQRMSQSSGALTSDASFAPPIVQDVLGSPGQPLDAATRSFMEPRFGYDFSHVRVHSNAAAEQSAHDVNALAFTVGHHIVFGRGRFAPDTSSGRKLIAHELTHVVQQDNAVRRDVVFGTGQYSPRTNEGRRLLAHEVAHVVQQNTIGSLGIQRQADEEHDKIVDVSKRTTGDLRGRAWELVWRMLTRYFPEYSPNVSGVTYEEKTPGIRADIREIEVKGKKVQSATVIVGKAFVESASEETLREHIMQLGESLSRLKAIPDPQAASGASTVWKIIHEKFPKKGHRLAGSSYDANLPGVATEFKGGSVQAGKATISWSAPKLFYGKAFLALPDSDKQSRLGEELKKVDKWCVENGKLVEEDLQDDDITLRIRGLTNSALVGLRDKVKDHAVKQYVESLLTTSTPLGQGLQKQMDGSARVVAGNVTIVVLPDDRNVTSIVTPGATDFAFPAQPAIQYSWDAHGIITRVTQPPSLTITIQTKYRPGASAETKSGYGRGTTAGDKAQDANTLRVHEGSHGVEYLALMLKANQEHPYPPTFTGQVGETRVAFEAKRRAFEAARTAFVNAVNAGKRPATRDVDCVGVTIDEYNREHHIREAPMCR